MRFLLQRLVLTSFLSLRQMSTAAAECGVGRLSQADAIAVDVELFTDYKFSLDQLMELAGLSVASAVYRAYYHSRKDKAVVAIAGPGNNGGDAMVAVRHLKLFGFKNVTLLNVREPSKAPFTSLVHQASEMGVTVTTDPSSYLKSPPDLIVDGLFGFSFKPPVRPDSAPFMELLSSAPTVASIDIPSGWDVEKGPSPSAPFMPDMLVSLTAPKACAEFFKGRYHFLGGRFVPQKLSEKYGLHLPPYPGIDPIVQL